MLTQDTRVCLDCAESKPLDQFGKHSAKPDGVNPRCRSCVSERTRQYRKANPEKVRAYKKKWAKTEKGRAMKAREKAKHKEKYAERERVRRAEKADEIREQWRRWADRNRDHVREYGREYQRSHPRPRAGQKHIAEDSVEMVRVLRRDPCAYCGGPGTEIDHITPVSSGGENEWWNFTAACGRCNRSKNARPLLTFLLDNPLK